MSVPESLITMRASRGPRAWAARGLLGTVVVALMAGCGSTSTSAPGASTVPAVGVSPTAAASLGGPASPFGAVGSPAAGAGGTIKIPTDPCTLVTDAELQTATGKPFTGGQKQSAGTTVECDWAAGSATLYLVIQPLDAKAFAAGKSVATPVSGLGDDAYQRATPSELHVAVSNVEVTAQISLVGDPAADQAAEAAVLRVVLAKLAT